MIFKNEYENAIKSNNWYKYIWKKVIFYLPMVMKHLAYLCVM